MIDMLPEFFSMAVKRTSLKNDIVIPRYYDPYIEDFFANLPANMIEYSIKELIEEGIVESKVGHEVGSMNYGTGEIPFIRTSDISNYSIIKSPKHCVSDEVYEKYREKQDIRAGDILMVRDGTYLVGSCSMVTDSDLPMVIQSHVLKFRINDNDLISRELFFLLLNTEIVRKQLRSIQFTADIIDTIGNRFEEIRLPISNDDSQNVIYADSVKKLYDEKEKSSLMRQNIGYVIQECINELSSRKIKVFSKMTGKEIKQKYVYSGVGSEWGSFFSLSLKKSSLYNDTLIPRFYDDTILKELEKFKTGFLTIGDLVQAGSIELSTGVEPGKMSYGTGDIPFIRTSDFSDWLIKHDNKHSVSNEIFEDCRGKSRKGCLEAQDILLVRDGTYLVGSTCMVNSIDTPSLYCGGLYRIRCKNGVDPYLILALLSMPVTKKQIRSIQFTRDIIDTIGKRVNLIKIPVLSEIPNELVTQISNTVKTIVDSGLKFREEITDLSSGYHNL